MATLADDLKEPTPTAIDGAPDLADLVSFSIDPTIEETPEMATALDEVDITQPIETPQAEPDLVDLVSFEPDTVAEPDLVDLVSFGDEPIPTTEGDRESISRATAFTTGVLQGATYDFADEISGSFAQLADWFYGVSQKNAELAAQGFKLDIPTTSQEVYEQARDEFRAKAKAAMEEHPGLTIAGAITGGLALPGLATARVASQGAKAGLALAAIEGAATGAGVSEANLSKGEIGRLAEDVIIGTGLGVATFGIGLGIGKGVKKIIEKRALSKGLSKVVGEEGEVAVKEASSKQLLEAENAAIESLSKNAEQNEAVFDIIHKGAVTDDKIDDFVNFMKSKDGIDINIPAPVAKELKDAQTALQAAPKLDGDILGVFATAEEREAISTSQALEEVSPVFKLLKTLREQGNEVEANKVAAFIHVDQERSGYYRWLSQKSEFKVKQGDYYKQGIEALAEPRQSTAALEASLRKQGLINQKTYQAYKASEAMIEYATKEAESRLIEDATGFGAFKAIADSRYVFQNADHTLGTDSLKYFDDIGNAVAAHTQYVNDRVAGVAPLWKEARKVKLSKEQIGRALSGEIQNLTEGQQQVVSKWRKVYDALIDEADEKFGIQIDKRANYIRQQSLRGADLVLAIRKRGDGILNTKFSSNDVLKAFNHSKNGRYNKTQAAKLTPKQRFLAEYKEAVSRLTDKDIQSMDQLMELAKDLKDNKVAISNMQKRALSYEASAAFARKGDLPEFIQEFDAERLFHSYLINLSKAAHLTQPMKFLESHIPVFHAAGMNKVADYTAKFLSDMSGANIENVGGKEILRLRYQLGIDSMFKGMDNLPKALQGPAKLSKDVAEAIPGIMGIMTGQVYPHLLGFNLRFPLRNAMQPFLMSAADMASGTVNPIKAAYGYKLATKSYLNTAKFLISKGPKAAKAMSKALEDAGFPQPNIYQRDFMNLSDGIRSGWIGGSKKGLDKWNQLGLTLYSYSDLQNRFVTMQMADSLTDNLLSALKKGKTGLSLNEKSAMTVVEGLPRQLKRIVERGNEKEIRQRLRSHYIASTQLIYGKAAASEFGRNFGSVMSMFTKWPTAVTSEILSDFHRKTAAEATMKLMTKWLAPYAALGIISAKLFDTKDPRTKELIGSRGLAAMAPIHAAGSITEVGRGPIISLIGEGVKTATKTAEGAFKGEVDLNPAKRFLIDAAFLHLPGTEVIKGIEHAEVMLTGKESKLRKKVNKLKRK